jgi:tetratricopeptide (TPR) repeat protein
LPGDCLARERSRPIKLKLKWSDALMAAKALRHDNKHPSGSPRHWSAAVVRGLSLVGIALAGGCGLNSQAQNASGVRLYQQGFYQGAQQRFQQAIYNDPTNADSYYNMAASYHKQAAQTQQAGDLEQAESYYNLCLDYNPNHRDCYRGLAVLLSEQGRSEEAFRLMEGWALRNPAMADPKVELARLFEEYGDKEAAQEHLLEALNVDPNNSRALAALGKLREQSGQPEQALAVYQRSLMNNRFQPEVAARVATLQPVYGSRVLGAPTVGGSRMVNSQQPTFR